MPSVSNRVVEAAIMGLEARKQTIDAHIAELRQMMTDTEGSHSDSPARAPKTRTMSAAARKRIAEAQKKRWAAVRGDAPDGGAAKSAPKKKRRLSPEGRQRIIEATKKRWALARAAKNTK